MAKDILLELDALQQPVEHYFIVELSADLRARQEDTLKTLPDALFEKVVWLDQLPKNRWKASSSPTRCWMPCRWKNCA